MPILDNHPAFAALLPATGSLLALDLSRRRIGLAGSDAARLLVTPLSTLERHGLDADLARLRRLVAAREAVALVVGWPLLPNGTVGAACQSVLGTVRHLDRALALPILLQDERYSTDAALDAPGPGLAARARPGAPVDHLAAAVILEDALRALRRLGSSRS